MLHQLAVGKSAIGDLKKKEKRSNEKLKFPKRCGLYLAHGD
jgi:hypothetical protein